MAAILSWPLCVDEMLEWTSHFATSVGIIQYHQIWQNLEASRLSSEFPIALANDKINNPLQKTFSTSISCIQNNR